MRTKLSDAVVELENIISRKRDGLNEQAIDDEILGYISIYKYGSEIYRNKAKQVLIGILVDSGVLRRKRDIIVDDWSDES